MSTLHYRRVRGDMIKTYQILSGKYDTNVVPNLKTTGIQATRGNDLRIFKTRFKYDLRKFYFTARVVDAWNSLSNWIVMANSTNTKITTNRHLSNNPSTNLHTETTTTNSKISSERQSLTKTRRGAVQNLVYVGM